MMSKTWDDVIQEVGDWINYTEGYGRGHIVFQWVRKGELIPLNMNFDREGFSSKVYDKIIKLTPFLKGIPYDSMDGLKEGYYIYYQDSFTNYDQDEFDKKVLSLIYYDKTGRGAYLRLVSSKNPKNRIFINSHYLIEKHDSTNDFLFHYLGSTLDHRKPFINWQTDPFEVKS